MTEKLCCVCKQTLPLSSFSFLKRNDTFHSYCKRCDALLARQRRAKNPIKTILSRLQSRAKRKNIICTLKEEDITLPLFCPILNIKLEFHSGKMEDNSYSIDRIDPLKGYTKENIQIISQKANRIKSNSSLEELILITEYMKGVYHKLK